MVVTSCATNTNCFPLKHRRLHKNNYSAIFANPQYKSYSKSLLLLARANQLAPTRLGIIVAKKNVQHATQRNRYKRIIREYVRLHANRTSLDIVILVKKHSSTLENHELSLLLSQLFKHLNKKLNADSRVTATA